MSQLSTIQKAVAGLFVLLIVFLSLPGPSFYLIALIFIALIMVLVWDMIVRKNQHQSMIRAELKQHGLEPLQIEKLFELYSRDHVDYKITLTAANGRKLKSVCKINVNGGPLFWSKSPAELKQEIEQSIQLTPPQTEETYLVDYQELREDDHEHRSTKEELLDQLYSPFMYERLAAIQHFDTLTALPQSVRDRLQAMADEDPEQDVRQAARDLLADFDNI